MNDYEFVGREYELNRLNDYFNGENFELIVVYGRRRIGKTSILKKFMTGKNCFYFNGSLLAHNNIQLMIKSFNEYLKLNNLTKIGVIENLSGLFDAIISLSKESRFLFIVDEFPYMLLHNPSDKFDEENTKYYMSIDVESADTFCKYIDNQFKKANLMFVVCGSSISIMKQILLYKNSMYYGRNTGTLRVSGLNHKQLKNLCPTRTNEELIKIYLITGGVPMLAKYFDNTSSILEVINKKFVDQREKNFPLDIESMFLVENINFSASRYIFSAITFGYREFGKILSFMNENNFFEKNKKEIVESELKLRNSLQKKINQEKISNPEKQKNPEQKIQNKKNPEQKNFGLFESYDINEVYFNEIKDLENIIATCKLFHDFLDEKDDGKDYSFINEKFHIKKKVEMLRNYLAALVKSEMISYENPYKNFDSCNTKFYITDHLCRFYFKFFCNFQNTNINNIKRYVEKNLNSYIGNAFEEVCKQYIINNDIIEEIYENIGKWWGSGKYHVVKNGKDYVYEGAVEIDIVFKVIEEDLYYIGSCKFTESPVDVDELELLKIYAQCFSFHSRFKYIIFSKSGFTENLFNLKDQVLLISLDDMFK